MNIVENDFIFGNIFSIFQDYFKQCIKDEKELNHICRTLYKTHTTQQNIMYSRSVASSGVVVDIKNHVNENNPYLDTSLLKLPHQVQPTNESKQDN